MKAVLTSALSVFGAVALTAAEAQFAIDDPYVGYYEGTFATREGEARVEAQIRSLGSGAYDGFIAFLSPNNPEKPIMNIGVIEEFRPVAGETNWLNALQPESLTVKTDDQTTKLTFPNFPVTGQVSPGLIKGKLAAELFGQRFTNAFDLVRKAPKPSPTLGAKPPKGATVIFDNRDRDQWKEAKWPTVNGALQVGQGNLTTKLALTNSYLLHLEFRTPHMPEARGQARGNSGVYLRSVFEVQVLDSFGLFPLADNDCGGVYQVRPPDWREVNASLPPGEWQTYDITFREGSMEDNRMPEITVVHNGRTVVNRAKIPPALVVNGTGGGEVGGGFLMLQDHGNPVQYRNIWVQPLE